MRGYHEGGCEMECVGLGGTRQALSICIELQKKASALHASPTRECTHQEKVWGGTHGNRGNLLHALTRIRMDYFVLGCYRTALLFLCQKLLLYDVC